MSELPKMEKVMTERGYEAWRFPDKWFQENKGKFTRKQLKRIKEILKERK